MGIDSLSPLQRPLDAPALLSEPKGIYSSDLIIRHALMIGLDDLRQNPWQLQIVFASLLDDPYTSNQYGQKVIDKATKWFLKTEIPVIMDYNLTSASPMPVIVISLQDSNEEASTLGDVNYVPSESTPAEWEPTTQKFSAQYDPATGLVTPSISVIANNQMLLVDGVGNRYPIIDIQVDTNGNENLLIQKGLVSDFSNCALLWSSNKLSVNLESLSFKEQYNIVCNVKGETDYLIYLYMITKYCLLRYKKTLLEGRGFERTTITCSKLMKNNSLAPVGSENIWCRVITLTGYCREYWATVVSEKITQSSFAPPVGPDGLKFSQQNFNATSFKAEPDQLDPSWLTSDGIGTSLES